MPKVKFGIKLGIFVDIFGSFRAGAYKRHVTEQDIKQLRKLIKPKRPYYSADRRDSVVLCSCLAQAHLVRVHYHRAEFQDVKNLTVPCNAVLLEKYRAAVIKLDGQRDDDHKRARYQKTDARNNYIHRAFYDALLCRQAVIAAYQDRGIKNLALAGVAENDVIARREEINALSRGVAVTKYLVLQSFVKLAYKDSLKIIDFTEDLVYRKIGVDDLFYRIAFLEFAHFFDY